MSYLSDLLNSNKNEERDQTKNKNGSQEEESNSSYLSMLLNGKAPKAGGREKYDFNQGVGVYNYVMDSFGRWYDQSRSGMSDVGWGDAAEASAATNEEAASWMNRAGELRRWANDNKDTLGDQYQTVMDSLQQITNAAYWMDKGYKGKVDQFSEWDTQEEYDQYVADREHQEEMATYNVPGAMSDAYDAWKGIQDARSAYNDLDEIKRYQLAGYGTVPEAEREALRAHHEQRLAELTEKYGVNNPYDMLDVISRMEEEYGRMQSQIDEASAFQHGMNTEQPAQHTDQKTAAEYTADLDKLNASIEAMDNYIQVLNARYAELENLDWNALQHGTEEEKRSYTALRDEWTTLQQQLTQAEQDYDSMMSRKWQLEKNLQYDTLGENADFASKNGYSVEFADDLLYRYINNRDGITSFLQPGEKHDADAWFIGENADKYGKYSNMTPEEVKNYNYLRRTQGAAAAYEYLLYLEPQMDARFTENIVNDIAGMTQSGIGGAVVANALSVPLTLVGGIGYLDIAAQNLGRKITGSYAPINYNSTAMLPTHLTRAVRQTSAGMLTDRFGTIQLDENEHPFLAPILNGRGLADVYQLGMSAIDSRVAGLTGHPAVATALLASSAATQGVLDALERGATDEQALTLGLWNGAFEALFEFVEINNLLKGNPNWVKNVVNQALIEGVGEGATSIANNIADAIIMADKSAINQKIAEFVEAGMDPEAAKKKALGEAVIDMMWDAIGGAASGAMSAGGMSMIQSGIANRNAGNYVQQNQMEDPLMDLARNMVGMGGYTGKLDTYTQRASARGSTQNLGKVYNEVKRVVGRQNMDQLAQALRGQGMSQREATNLASAISLDMNGIELTKSQERLLEQYEGSEKVMAAVVEVLGSTEYFDRNAGVMKLHGKAMEKTTTAAQAAPGQEKPTGEVSVPEAKVETTHEVSEDGETHLISEPEKTVKIQGIESIKDGKMTLKLEDGSVVDSEDVSFGNEDDALVYEILADMNVSAENANAIMQEFKTGNVLASEFALDLQEAYQYGRHNQTLKESNRSASAQLVWNDARMASMAETDTRQAQVEETYQKAAETLKQTGKAKGEHHAVLEEGITALSLTESQKASYRLADQVAQAAQVDVVVYSGTAMEQGYYKGDTVYLNLNAYNKNRQSMMAFVLGHELVHRAKKGSPRKYQKFADFLVEQYGKQGSDVDAMIAEQMQAAKENGIELTRDKAFEEVVADACQRMLLDTNAGQKLAQFGAENRQNKSILDDIKRWITEFIEKLRSIFKDVEPDSLAAQEFAKIDEKVKQILADMYVDMTMEAGEHLSAIKEVFGEDALIETNERGEFTMAQNEDKKLDATGKERLRQLQKEGASFKLSKKADPEGYDTTNLHWAISSEIISEKDQAVFWEAIANINKRRYNSYARTKNGGYIIETDNVMMFTDADWKAPTLSKVIVFPYGEYVDTSAERAMIRNEARKYGTTAKSTENVESIFGPGFVSEFHKPYRETYGREDGNREGKDGSTVLEEGNIRGVRYDGEDGLLSGQRNKLPVGEDTSPRALLANAFEGVVQDDIEKRNLEKYRSRVAELDAEEANLRELRAQIKELSFAKGPRDKAKLSELRTKANATANRIATLDKILLRFEASAPLQEVIKREKEAVRKRTQDRVKAAAATQRKEAVESMEKRQARAKLDKLVLDTASWIRAPKKGAAKCPDILKKPYMDFLNGIDTSSQRMAKGGDPTKADLRMINAMNALADSVEKITAGQDPSKESTDVLDAGYLDLPADFVKKLRDMIGQIREIMEAGEGRVINSMTAKEVRDLSKLIKTLNHSIKEMSTLYANQRFANVQELGVDSVRFMNRLGQGKSTSGLSDFVQWENALPYYAFKRFGIGGESVFEGLMDAQDKLAFLAEQIFEFQAKTWTGEEADAWSKDVHTIELEDDMGEDGEVIKRSITLTTADAMSIYCLYQREQGRKHLLGGGVRVIGIQKGSKKSPDSITNLTVNDIDTIIGSLNDRQVKVAEAMQKFMSTVCAEWGNEISMKRFLTREFTETNYFPIESDDENMTQKDPAAQQSDLFRLLNISATKGIDPNANNRAIVRNIFDVFIGHSTDMARLNAFALPLLDYMKWYNYREKQVTEKGQVINRGVRESMRTAYGDAAKRYVMNLIKDVNGRHSDGGLPSFYSRMLKNAKTAAVGSSLRVATLQITSYPRAALVLSPKSLALGLKKLPNIKRAKEYCGIALWKSFGFYDTNISRSIEDQMKGVKNVKQKIIELSLKGAEIGDALTWGALWNACEYEVASTNKYDPGTKEFYEAVGKKLREVVYATQVVDSILTRSEAMRSKDSKMKELTSFMSEPTLSANILMDAGFTFDLEKRRVGSAKIAWQNTGKYVGKAIAVYSMGQIAAALMEAFWDAWRDDEDEEFWRKFVDSFAENLVLDIIPFNKIPIISDIVEAALSLFGLGYFSTDSLSSTAMSQSIAAVKAWSDVLNGKSSATVYNALYKSMRAVSSVLGVSVSGVMREGVALWNNTAGAADSTLKIRTYEDADARNDKLYKALVEGDMEYVERMYPDEKKAEEAIRKMLKEKYLAGEIDKKTARDYLTKYGGKDINEAYFDMKEWDYEKVNDDEYKKYQEFYTAVETGVNLKKVIKEYTDNGVDPETLRSQITDYFKPIYVKLSAADRASMKGYLLNALEQCGAKRWNAEDMLAEWDFEASHKKSYDDMVDAYKDGKMTADALKEILLERGMEEDEADDRLVELDISVKYGIEYSDRDTAYAYGILTEKDLRDIYEKKGYTEEETDILIDAHNWIKDNDRTDLPVSQVEAYVKPLAGLEYSVADTGMDIDVFLEEKKYINAIESDKDEDGDAVAYSRINKAYPYIDSLPLTAEQKTALAVACGWKLNTVLKNKLW